MSLLGNTGCTPEGLHILETFPYNVLHVSQALSLVPEAAAAESPIFSIIETS